MMTHCHTIESVWCASWDGPIKEHEFSHLVGNVWDLGGLSLNLLEQVK